MAMNIGVFTALDDFRAEVGAVIAEVHASSSAPGVDRPYVAGELEAETAARYVTNGIPLNDATLAGLTRTAEALGADVYVLG